jgi:hypothetical protein
LPLLLPPPAQRHPRPRLHPPSPGAVALDLSGLPLEDWQLAAILARLPRLQELNLEGCKKLTAAVTRLLLRGGDGAGDDGGDGDGTVAAAAPRLRWAGVQRCFQLNGASFDDVLRLSRLPGSALDGAAASHLALEGGACRGGGGGCDRWVGAACGCASGSALAACPPRALPPLPPSSLRVVALTNCRVAPTALLALARAAPTLEYLFLGGSFVRVELPPGDAGAGAGVAAGTAAGAIAIAAAAGADTPGSDAAAPPAPPRWLANVEARLGLPQELPSDGWGGGVYNPASRAAAAARARGLALAAAALALPALRVLEATFFEPPALSWLEAALAMHARRGGGGAPQVWDFCRPACVRAAARELAAAGAGARASSLASALRAAVNCSSPSRLTPLHVAAEAGGCGATVRALVFDLGASVSGRDSHGQEPLFVACEAGHAAAAAALLRAGACATANTTSGESPLYIASLKGARARARRGFPLRVPWVWRRFWVEPCRRAPAQAAPAHPPRSSPPPPPLPQATAPWCSCSCATLLACRGTTPRSTATASRPSW